MMPCVIRFSTDYALIAPLRVPYIIISGSTINVVVCTRKPRDLLSHIHKRKSLLCPLLHPRLCKSRDKPSYYQAPTQYNFHNSLSVNQSVNGANANW